MPIQKAISIIIDGSGSHFDPELVKVFLSITADKIASVFISDSSEKISAHDLEILKEQNLQSIYDFSSKEDKSEQEQNILDIFNKYYLGEKEHENE